MQRYISINDILNANAAISSCHHKYILYSHYTGYATVYYTITKNQSVHVEPLKSKEYILAMIRNPMLYSHGRKKGKATEMLIPSTSRTENPLRTEHVHTIIF